MEQRRPSAPSLPPNDPVYPCDYDYEDVSSCLPPPHTFQPGDREYRSTALPETQMDLAVHRPITHTERETDQRNQIIVQSAEHGLQELSTKTQPVITDEVTNDNEKLNGDLSARRLSCDEAGPRKKLSLSSVLFKCCCGVLCCCLECGNSLP